MGETNNYSKKESNIYINLISQGKCAFFSVRNDGSVEYASPACMDLLGFTPEEITSNPALIPKAVHPDYLPQFKTFWEYYEQNKSFSEKMMEIAWFRKDGTILHTENTYANIKNGSGKVTGFYTIMRDVSMHKLTEKTLQESAANWQSTFDAIKDAVCLLDKQWRIMQCNKTVSEFTGKLQNELLGQVCYQVIHGLDTPPKDCPLERMQTTLKRESSVAFLYNKWFNITMDPLLDNNGRLTGAVHIMSDITAQKYAFEEIHKLNKELERRVIDRTAQLEVANKELEAFSYSVSHDLRAPLRAIDGFSRIILESHSKKIDNETKRLLNIIRSGTCNMGELIDNLLSFSHIGRTPMEKEEIDMAGAAKFVFNELKLLNPKQKITLKIKKLPLAVCDRAMIKQVFSNLLSNAVKFSSKKKNAVIEIGCNDKDGITIYWIKDNGVGFNMKYSDKLFGVFQRLHSQEEFEGTGVGLAIAQRIIHRHGGRIWAEGAPGKGATFFFTIPH
ncbi:MAG: PAS domain S-box protein [Planctomycetes bacterium]|nr:PAS domain S-box protein [Planctomycetota bacterium]